MTGKKPMVRGYIPDPVRRKIAQDYGRWSREMDRLFTEEEQEEMLQQYVTGVIKEKKNDQGNGT